MKKRAFTLAEVLITLGIIGVVAALTLPTLIQKQQEQATVVSVKKFYSAFSQAYLQAIEENGTLDNWGLTDSENYENDDGKLEHTDESLANYDKFLTIMSKYVKSVKYEKIGKQNEEETTGFVMPDGTRITGVWLSPSTCTTETSYCGDFYITTKGKKRETVGGKMSKNTFLLSFIDTKLYQQETLTANLEITVLMAKIILDAPLG